MAVGLAGTQVSLEDGVSVLLLSGGLDSLVLLAQECQASRPPRCVSFDYGQRHYREIAAAVRIAEHYGVEHSILQLDSWLFAAGSALTGNGPVPQGKHYEDPAQSATVVPNRNLVMLSCAAALAAKEGHETVLFAAHVGDAAIYKDCRPAFVALADAVMRAACGVGIEAPSLLSLTKRGIVELGRNLDAPLDWAWSCYVGGEQPCQQCGACIERREAGA